jgi:hypothetical protein
MPDNRLTWANIRENLRKFAALYIVMGIVAVVLADLLYTYTAPRVPDDQTVLIYLASAYSEPERLDDIAADMLSRTQADDPTLEQVSFEELMYTSDTDYTSGMLLMTRLALGEADAFLATEACMNALVRSGVCLPLDDYYAAGWLRDSGLEPWYADIEYEETGEKDRVLAGFHLDAATALKARGAFDSEGAYLAVMVNGTNIDTTLKAVEIFIEDIMKESHHD